MSVTQKDIARALNVSLITVSRALNDSGYVSSQLKRRILDYAKEVDYVPQKASQVLVRNKTRRIAVFSSPLPTYFWDDIGKGITVAAQQLRPFRYEVHYRRIPENNSRAYIATLKRELTEGAEAVGFVNQWMYDMDAVISLLERAGLPYVTMNIDAPQSRRLCYVGPDYRAGGRLAAEFIGKSLRFKSHPRVLVINTKAKIGPDWYAPDINRLREEGFLAVMRRDFDDVAVDVEYISAASSQRSAHGRLKSLLRSSAKSVDAVYLIPAYNFEFLPGLEKVDPSRTISVVHDLDPLSDHYLGAQMLTAVIYQNPILQGYYAVKVLEKVLEEGKPRDSSIMTIEHSIVLAENRKLFRNHYLFAGMVE